MICPYLELERYSFRGFDGTIRRCIGAKQVSPAILAEARRQMFASLTILQHPSNEPGTGARVNVCDNTGETEFNGMTCPIFEYLVSSLEE